MISLIYNLFIGGLTVGVIKAFINPGIRIRSGALRLIAVSQNGAVTAEAFRLYRSGNALIHVSYALINVGKVLFDLGRQFGSLGGKVRGFAESRSIGGGLGLASELIIFDSKLRGVEDAINAIRVPLGLPEVKEDPSILKPVADILGHRAADFLSSSIKIIGELQSKFPDSLTTPTPLTV